MEKMEIEFRGKEKRTGKWVYGFYIANFDPTKVENKIRDAWIYEGLANLSTAIPVEIETVSQYTGLKSSDGECGLPIKQAYFGDIIRFYNTDGKEIKAEIIWYEKEHCIGFQRLTDGFIYTQRMFNDSGYFQPSKINFEIISNIYENLQPAQEKSE